LSSSEVFPHSVVLKSGRDGVFRRTRHPWIYSQAVEEVRGDPAAAGLVPVVCADGSTLGWGYYSPGSLIAVRLVELGEGKPPADWLERRMRSARDLRASLRVDSDAYRLVNAEGDFIPGLVVDIYAGTAVVSVHTRGMEAETGRIAACLGELHPGVRVYLKRDEHFARVEKLGLPSGYLAGEGDGTSVITEGGTRILVDFAHGQKTGFYLDQRENRMRAAGSSRGKTMLNLFSYTGGFALQAVRAGAIRVVSVESSRPAIETAQASVALNPGLDPSLFEWRQADVFDAIAVEEEYDLLICDPPPFARRRSDLEAALKGYLSLNQQALRLLAAGGQLHTFSCSGAVDRDTFRQVLSEAALRSGRRVRFLAELHAGADHPVAAVHPEGEYLKGWVLHAE
jgi:23S rRNA (cytosine1962-C5)-methyltransferase